MAVGALLLMVTASSRHTLPRLDAAVTPSPTPSSSTYLQNEKLQQQIRQLEISNEDASNVWHYLIVLAPTAAAFAAILTFSLGWSTQRNESKRQKEKELDQRTSESIREFDGRFASVVTNLGSDSVSLQASAASTLPIFLAPRYRDFGSHIIRVVSANLRFPRDKIVLDLLIDVLGSAIRYQYPANAEEEPADGVDLTDTQSPGLNITRAKLRGKFVADGANLSRGRMDGTDLWKAELRRATLAHASLRQANLGQARLDGADISHAIFHGCPASSVSLRGADGRFAQFQGAHLQSAHLDGADLRGARFEGADLADCYFLQAKLDTGALTSILKSNRWRSAHFEPDVRARLISGTPAITS